MNKTPKGQNPVYMGPKEGPFKCSNCEYFTSPHLCDKPEMIKAQDKSGYAIVAPDGCCNYFEKK